TGDLKNTGLAKPEFVLGQFKQVEEIRIVEIIQLNDEPLWFPTFGCSDSKLPSFHVVWNFLHSSFVFFILSVGFLLLLLLLLLLPCHHHQCPLQLSCEELQQHQTSDAFVLVVVKHGHGELCCVVLWNWI
ncbi:hypothetical protein LINGRAHAP2_LOCUS35603, partial [Linum grandiflorum]